MPTPISLRRKLVEEAMLSMRVAWEVEPLLPSGCDLGAIHVDVNPDPKYASSKYYEEVYWMIGADNVTQIPKWYQADKFVQEVRFAVANRKTDSKNFEGTDEEKEIMDNMHVTYVDTPIIEISSSMVRERVQQGKSIKYLVPQPVEEYIRDNDLYKNG